MNDITKFCITCNKEGHHYNECPTVPFWSLVTASFGLPISNVEKQILKDGIEELGCKSQPPHPRG